MLVVEYYDTDGTRRREEFAGDERQVVEKLRDEGKIVLSVRKKIYSHKGVREQDVAVTLRSLGDLLKSGIPLSQALHHTASSLPQGSYIRRVFHSLENAVLEGLDLSTAMETYPSVFSPTVIFIIRGGEESGRLPEAVYTASEHILKTLEIRREMIRKISYPVAVFILGIICTFVNTKFVIPRILNSELFRFILRGGKPASVVILEKLGVAVPALIGLFFLTVVAFFILYRLEEEGTSRFLARIPFLRDVMFSRSFFIAFFSLGKLLESGVRLSEALDVVSSTSDMAVVRNQFREAAGLIRQGRPFPDAFTYLDSAERLMLQTAVNVERLIFNLNVISERLYRRYVERIKALTPAIYAITLGFIAVLIILMVSGIMIPYAKILGGISGGI